MPTYIALLNYTQQGIKEIEKSPERIDAARKAIEAAGGKMLSFHVTMGQYDGVVVLDLPNDNVAATVALSVAKLGNARLETMRAFTEDEFAAIAGRLG
ncbi:MAG: GYD domain-containing protein [Dehalococcoidia bacterium]|jgi:uncharacterized protein with GYD domain|nr:GYD domain-containing protein [Dehalococcoidia bacterium]|tara:strand:- start:584 stop:877 length:294 start_codon:yes stop_codon:yes gene_type:complete